MKHPVNHAISTFKKLSPEQQDAVLAILNEGAKKPKVETPGKKRKKPGPKPGTKRAKKDADPAEEAPRKRRRIVPEDDEDDDQEPDDDDEDTDQDDE